MVKKRDELFSYYYEKALNQMAYDKGLIPKDTYEKIQEQIEKDIRAVGAGGGFFGLA